MTKKRMVCTLSVISFVWFMHFQGIAAVNKKEDQLRFCIAQAPISLHSVKAHTSEDALFLLNTMEGLVSFDTNLKIKPALATSWKISEDQLTYTFYIRSGVKWSDGVHLKAQHFVDAWSHLKKSDVQSKYQSFLSDVKSFTAINDFEFTVNLFRKNPNFLELLTFWATFPYRTDQMNRNIPPSLGPYRAVVWEPTQEVRLERNLNYYAYAGQSQRPRKVTVNIGKNSQSCTDQFYKGNSDFLLGVSTESFLNKGAERVLSFSYLGTYYLGFNFRQPLMQSAELRQAFAKVIDRENIPSVLQSGQIPAKGLIPRGMPGSEWSDKILFEPDKAPAHLAKAGFEQGKGLRKITLWIEEMERAKELGEYFVAQFQNLLGVKLEYSVGPREQFVRSLTEGLDLFVWHWGADYSSPLSFLEVFRSNAPTNYGAFSSDKFDSILNRSLTEENELNRVRELEKAHAQLTSESLALLPLFHQKRYVLLSPRVKNLVLSKFNYLMFDQIVTD